ncbi:MAG TPA: GGDEF and EAL domain-containing protein [Pseudoflavonifractor sp.]|nr:GGDEF and EAL domain-containing protein [Pseudoflavonifractor sp.]
MDEIESMLERLGVDLCALYTSIVSSTDDYVYVVDLKENMGLVSEHMAEEFALPGRVGPELMTAWLERIHPTDRGPFRASMQRMLRGETEGHDIDYRAKNREGEYVWLHCRGRLTWNGAGEPVSFIGAIAELGWRERADRVTCLLTEHECEKQVETIFGQGGGGGLILLGMDDFTRVNSLNGKAFGDLVLRRFAQGVQDCLLSGGAVYRMEGDKFALVLPGAAAEDLKELYGRIHAFSNRRRRIDGVPYFCTVSAGMVLLGRDGNSYDRLIRCADSALRASKRRGKNTCTLFTGDLICTELRVQRLINQLQLNVVNGMEHFHLVYQPIARADGGGIAGAEAVLRWSCEELGAIFPGEFVPLLESSGLIIPVGYWVLEEAVMVCRRWVGLDPDFVMNINVSYLQLIDPGFLPAVRSILERYALEPRHVVLEMTESYFVTDIDALRGIFGGLRAMGIRVAMDDFGTGYSSLSLLSQLPADEVKIDRAFVRQIDQNEFNRAFLCAVIRLCHSVGISVCVEGVETEEELCTVAGLGADHVQGFHFSKPIPAERFCRRYLC